MKIIQFKPKLKYRYLWLKHVTGIDLSNHCARCLVGRYSGFVNNRGTEFGDITLPYGCIAHYLCGVRNYVDNIHIAMIPKPGGVVEIHDELCDFLAEGVERIDIRQDFIPPGAVNSEKAAFRTCRNWQFAHWLNANAWRIQSK